MARGEVSGRERKGRGGGGGAEMVVWQKNAPFALNPSFKLKPTIKSLITLN